MLPPLSEVKLPESVKENDIEILLNPVKKTHFWLQDVFSFLNSTNKGSNGDMEDIANHQILCHHSKGLVAIVYRSNIFIHLLQDFLHNNKPSPIFLRSNRFNGKIVSFSWTFENQITFLVGTTTSLYYGQLSSWNSESLDIGGLTLRELALPQSFSIDNLTLSPQGRYCACSSYEKKGCILLVDTWQDTSQYYYLFNSWTTIERLQWTLTGQNLIVTSK